MNIVQIWCGLGNQLFQYTFSKYLELVTNRKSVLYLKEYNSSFDCFDLKYEKLTQSTTCEQLVQENGLFVPPPNKNGFDNAFFVGWWQNREYFLSVADSIISDFVLKEEYLTDELKQTAMKMQQQGSVAIHFRRTDYVVGDGSKLFESMELSYYERALSRIINELDSDNIVPYLFSDDEEFIGSIKDINGIQTYAMPTRSSHEDIYLMSQAKHHIIANSTFSWWGAATSIHRKDGITVAPQKWYRAMPAPNLYLDNWIVI